eukprot:11204759-Lingulodinium_polyedra.AAC.1
MVVFASHPGARLGGLRGPRAQLSVPELGLGGRFLCARGLHRVTLRNACLGAARGHRQFGHLASVWP